MNTQQQKRLYDAMKRISAYDSPEKLHRIAERTYGLSGNEAIEMAYDNGRAEAKAPLRKRPKPWFNTSTAKAG